MLSKRVSLALALSAVLFVTSGFAVAKKIQHNERSREGNDSSFQTANLLDVGSSVSSGGDSAYLSNVSLDASHLIPNVTLDEWKGGTGNWSNCDFWTTDCPPGPNDDVSIYSQGSDDVTLDTSAHILSLTLGGTLGTSKLEGDGTAQSLTIAYALTVNQTGILVLNNDTMTANNSMTAGVDSTNLGKIDLEHGSKLTINGNLTNSNLLYTSYELLGGNNTLNVTGTLTNNASGSLYVGRGDNDNDVANVGTLVNSGLVNVAQGSALKLTNGITHVLTGSEFGIYGTFTAGSDSGFVHLNLVDGGVDLGNGQTNKINPGGGVLNVNSTGHIDVVTTSPQTTTLQINGDVNNSGRVSTSYEQSQGGATLTIAGMLTNNPRAELDVGKAARTGDVANVGTLVNNGTVTVFSGSTLNLTNQPNGITDIVAGSKFDISGNFTAGGNSAFAKLATVEGTLLLADKLTTTHALTETAGKVEVAELVNNSVIDLEKGSTLTVKGNVTNNDSIYTSSIGHSGNTLEIDGTLTNVGTVTLWGNFYYGGRESDTATVAKNVENSGGIGLMSKSALTVEGDLTNSGGIKLDDGSMLTVKGNVINADNWHAPLRLRRQHRGV